MANQKGKVCAKKNEDEIKVRFCPKCKSANVKYVFGLGNLFGVIPKMRCGNCGSEMPSFPILVTTKELLSKSNKFNESNKAKENKK